MISAAEQQKRYRELMGDEAADRQKDNGVCTHCAGKNGRHHKLCKRNLQPRERDDR